LAHLSNVRELVARTDSLRSAVLAAMGVGVRTQPMGRKKADFARTLSEGQIGPRTTLTGDHIIARGRLVNKLPGDLAKYRTKTASRM
jgi:hypothetical protein